MWMNIKLCEFCTILPTINFFSNKFVLSERVLTFEPAIHLVCSINLKKIGTWRNQRWRPEQFFGVLWRRLPKCFLYDTWMRASVEYLPPKDRWMFLSQKSPHFVFYKQPKKRHCPSPWSCLQNRNHFPRWLQCWLFYRYFDPVLRVLFKRGLDFRIRPSLIQASRVSVSFVRRCALWVRKWAPSLEWQPYLCLLYGNIVIIWY